MGTVSRVLAYRLLRNVSQAVKTTSDARQPWAERRGRARSPFDGPRLVRSFFLPLITSLLANIGAHQPSVKQGLWHTQDRPQRPERVSPCRLRASTPRRASPSGVGLLSGPFPGVI